MPEYEFIKVRLPDSSDKKVQFVTNGYYLFFNAQHLLIQLNALERSFFDFLCEEMRVIDNDITIDSSLKGLFIGHLTNYTKGKKGATINKLTKYVQKLKEIGLILVTQDKGRYIINPKYVFKGGKAARLGYLKKLIESRLASKLPIGHLIDAPSGQFQSEK